jgi:hypothetical protein
MHGLIEVVVLLTAKHGGGGVDAVASPLEVDEEGVPAFVELLEVPLGEGASLLSLLVWEAEGLVEAIRLDGTSF